MTLVCALALGGCALSLPTMSASTQTVDPEPTGSIVKPSLAISPVSRVLDAEDWRRARAALGTALDPQGNGATVAWDNPASGRRGSFVPVAAPYPVDGRVCRAFIAKIDGREANEHLQGSACRIEATDDWDVKDIRTFKS